MKNIKNVILGILIILEVIGISYIYKNNNKELKPVTNRSGFAMYIEDEENGQVTENNKKKYSLYNPSDQKWPGKDYALNLEESYCTNLAGGDKKSLNNLANANISYSNSKINLTSTKTLLCTLYFDIKIVPCEIVSNSYVENANGWYNKSSYFKAQLKSNIDQTLVNNVRITENENLTNTKSSIYVEDRIVHLYGVVNYKDGTIDSCDKIVKVDSIRPEFNQMMLTDRFDLYIGGSTDNLTPEDKIEYFHKIGDNNLSDKGELIIENGDLVHYNGKKIEAYTVDLAGNTSKKISKTLSITNPSEKQVEEVTYYEYNCTMYESNWFWLPSNQKTKKIYAVDDKDAKSQCRADGIVKSVNLIKCCNDRNDFEEGTSCTCSYRAGTVSECADGAYLQGNKCILEKSGSISTSCTYPCIKGNDQFGWGLEQSSAGSSCPGYSGNCSSLGDVGNKYQTSCTSKTTTNKTYVYEALCPNGPVTYECHYQTKAACESELQGNTHDVCRGQGIGAETVWIFKQEKTSSVTTYTYKYKTCEKNSGGNTYGSPNCTNGTSICPSGYTPIYSGSGTGNANCVNEGESCSANKTCTESGNVIRCEGTPNTGTSCSSGGSQEGNFCYYNEDPIESVTKYRCEYYNGTTKLYKPSQNGLSGSTQSGYDSYTTAENYCKNATVGTYNKTGNSETRYKCKDTDLVYDSIQEATEKCSHYCAEGEYYNGKCYKLA